MNLSWFPLLFGLFATVSSYRNIKQFCLSNMLRDISDETNSYNETSSICSAILDFDVDIRSANEICSYYSPFPTYEVKNDNACVSCSWKSDKVCRNETDHFVVNTCVQFTSSQVAYKNYKCPPGYKQLKVTSLHIARWITSLTVRGGSDGVWVHENSTVDNSGGTGKKYIATKPILGQGIQIGSIQRGPEDVERIGVCASNNMIKPVAPVDYEKKKYFYTKNVYQPKNFGSNKNEDILKDMDAVCKKIDINSMIAPSGDTHLEANVYMGIQASPDFAITNPTNCHASLRQAGEFTAIVHNITGGVTKKQGVPGSKFYHQCADSLAKAVVTTENGGLTNVPAFARRRIACLKGKVDLPRDYACEAGWYLSKRIKTVPVCFKEFYPTGYTTYITYEDSKKFCAERNASLATHEEYSDHDAAEHSNACYFLAGINLDKSVKPAYRTDFVWETPNRGHVPVSSDHRFLSGDPNKHFLNQGRCQGYELCILRCHLVWVDHHCDCHDSVNGWYPTMVSCMKEAFLE